MTWSAKKDVWFRFVLHLRLLKSNPLPIVTEFLVTERGWGVLKKTCDDEHLNGFLVGFDGWSWYSGNQLNMKEGHFNLFTDCLFFNDFQLTWRFRLFSEKTPIRLLSQHYILLNSNNLFPDDELFKTNAGNRLPKRIMSNLYGQLALIWSKRWSKTRISYSM